MTGANQTSLFGLGPNEESIPDATPADVWERDTAKRALDELFSLTNQYKTSQAYRNLLEFVTRFRSYSPPEQYLSHSLDQQEWVPPISLERVMKAAGLIESMGRQRMKPRKP